MVHDRCSGATRCSPRGWPSLSTRQLAHGVLQTLARFQGGTSTADDRGGAGPDPARDALRRPTRGARARRRPRLLRHGRRHAAVRRCSSASCAAGACAARRRRRACCPHADRALDWIERLRRPRRRRLRRVPARAATAGWPTRAGRTPGTRIRFADGRSPTRRSRCARSRATCTPPTCARADFAADAGRRRPARDATGAGPHDLQGARSTRTSGSTDRGWFALGLDARQAPDRRPRAPTWATACGPASSTTSKAARVAAQLLVRGPVQRLGHPHARRRRWRAYNPRQLPLRLGLAPRQRHRACRPRRGTGSETRPIG